MKTKDIIAKWLFVFLSACFVACVLSCGSTRTIEHPLVVERVSHDTINLTKVVNFRDTTWMHDSIVVTAEGVDRWHTRYVTKWRERTDTIYVSRRDSVPTVVTVTKTIERTSWKQRMKAAGVGAAIAIALCAAVVVAVRRFRRKV